MKKEQTKEMRLNKFIAQSGITSRRKADELIEQGEILVNKKPVTTLGTKIDPQKDIITYNGKQLRLKDEFIYVALNKPKNYITTLKDEKGRQTVLDLLPKELESKGLKPIGRLDKNTEGLLVLTNDLEFINQLTHPRYENEKEYKVETEGNLSPEAKSEIEKGIENEELKKTLPCKIKVLNAQEHKTTLTITIREGQNRQVRKMFKHFGYPVLYLQRIRIGKLTLGTPPIANLPKGKTQLIDKKCLQA
jgi:23S rRNA pseudouridine2605 synthase